MASPTSTVVAKTGLTSEEVRCEWVIEKFDTIITNKELINTQAIHFKVGEGSTFPTEWRIFLLVGLEKVKNVESDWIGLHRQLLNPPVVKEHGIILSSLIITIPNVNGKRGDFFKLTLKVQDVVEHQRMGSGVKKMLKKDAPLSELPLKNGSLTINLHLTVFKNIHGFSKQIFVMKRTYSDAFADFEKISNEKLLKDLDDLQKADKDVKDFKLISKTGKEHFASKAMLFGKCALFFKEMFGYPQTKPSSGIAKLDDVSDDSLEVVLKYLYTGKINYTHLTSPERILDVAHTAEKFMFYDLHNFCDEMFAEKWDKKHPKDMLQTAKKLHLAKAVKKINEFTKGG